MLNPIKAIIEFFQKSIPEPNEKNFHTQLGVHFEEVSEMVDMLTSDDAQTIIMIDNLSAALTALGDRLKSKNSVVSVKPENRVLFLDGICDQIVTGTGVGYMLKMNVPDALDEVNRSNFSKFDENGNPIFNENRKIMKGPNYSPPDLTPFV